MKTQQPHRIVRLTGKQSLAGLGWLGQEVWNLGPTQHQPRPTHQWPLLSKPGPTLLCHAQAADLNRSQGHRTECGMVATQPLEKQRRPQAFSGRSLSGWQRTWATDMQRRTPSPPQGIHLTLSQHGLPPTLLAVIGAAGPPREDRSLSGQTGPPSRTLYQMNESARWFLSQSYLAGP